MIRLVLTDDLEKKHIVHALRSQGQLWFHLDGRTYCVEVEKRRRSSQKSDSASGDQVLAPMPGKVLKVAATKGQDVKAGQTLVVMEAMKMEYSLSAGRDGRVAAVNCKEGQQVELGATLVQLETDSTDKGNS